MNNKTKIFDKKLVFNWSTSNTLARFCDTVSYSLGMRITVLSSHGIKRESRGINLTSNRHTSTLIFFSSFCILEMKQCLIFRVDNKKNGSKLMRTIVLPYWTPSYKETVQFQRVTFVRVLEVSLHYVTTKIRFNTAFWSWICATTFRKKRQKSSKPKSRSFNRGHTLSFGNCNEKLWILFMLKNS